MNAEDIRSGYSPDAQFIGDCGPQLETAEILFRAGNAIGLLNGLVYADIGKQPLPDWLYAGLISLLADIAINGHRAPSISALSTGRRSIQSEILDLSRHIAVIHIRNLQGKGDKNPITRHLPKSTSEAVLRKLGNFPQVWGATWEDAYAAAECLLEGTPFEAGEEAMKKAHQRFKKSRYEPRTTIVLPDPLKQILGIAAPATSGGIGYRVNKID